jgi:flagellar biosynthesis protein FliQ
MEALVVVLEPARALLQQIGAFLPRLLFALLIVVAGWLLAKAVRLGVVKALRAFNFHVLSERAGTDAFLQQGGSRKDTSDVFGLLAYVTVLLAALMIAFSGLGLTAVTDLLVMLLLFVPKLVVALLIIVFGSYFARFVGQSTTGHCAEAGIGDAALIGRAVQYAVMVFVVLLAVDQLDVGGRLIQQTFLILLAGVVVALAIAFGFGGRERAARLLERWFP